MSTTETPTATSPPRELHRSRDDRVVAGVAGGLGDYFDLSPAFFRVAFAILTLVGGAGILLYVVSALVIPDEGRTESIVSEALRRHRDRPWLLVGVALVAVASVSLVAQADFWPNTGFAWLLLLLGGLAIVIAQRRSDAAPSSAQAGEIAAPRSRKPSIVLPALGLLLAAAGVLALVDAAGADVRWDIAFAVGAIVSGAAVGIGAIFDRRTGGLVVVGVGLAALAIAVSAVDVRLEGPIGKRTFAPAAAAEVHRDYDVSIGELTVDLTVANLRDGRTEIDANVGIGELNVVVPEGVNVEVDATASAGDVTVFGRHDSDANAHVVVTDTVPGAPKTLVVDAHVGLGNVAVYRG